MVRGCCGGHDSGCCCDVGGSGVGMGWRWWKEV
ncbi:hypothetical protein A2U01_0099211, partial [Trifolium medium]|nr:hypothetical protein [Trifolium medium]